MTLIVLGPASCGSAIVLIADAIDAIAVELLLVEVIGAQAELQDRHTEALYCTTSGAECLVA